MFYNIKNSLVKAPEYLYFVSDNQTIFIYTLSLVPKINSHT